MKDFARFTFNKGGLGGSAEFLGTPANIVVIGLVAIGMYGAEKMIKYIIENKNKTSALPKWEAITIERRRNDMTQLNR